MPAAPPYRRLYAADFPLLSVGEKEPLDLRWDVRRRRLVDADVFCLDLKAGGLS